MIGAQLGHALGSPVAAHAIDVLDARRNDRRGEHYYVAAAASTAAIVTEG